MTVRGPEEIVGWFASGGPTLVALSGGVDSSVVAALGKRALGPGLRAVTLTGPAVASEEVERAREVARHLDLRHQILRVDPLAVEGYRANASDRCYFCRRTETAALRSLGDRAGIARYVDGVLADDLGDDRPGLRAMDEARFEHPLLWAGWGKAEVRAYARAAGLPNWDRPSDACLASRVPHGTPVDAALLQRIERAEAAIRARGYRRVRVRAEGLGARVEVDPDELGRLASPEETEAVSRRLSVEGFAQVVIDPRGYRRRANA